MCRTRDVFSRVQTFEVMRMRYGTKVSRILTVEDVKMLLAKRDDMLRNTS